ncbi:hypothetical protein F4679DRAFT_582233 [Xylaria curta]|nr:hypothetical protein F4679DRAFT_582233 [Xylaria curta]
MAVENEDTSFEYQLYSVGDDTAFRILNEAREIQRAHIFGDDTSKLLVKADLHTVIHGKNSNSPATLIVLIFRFIGADLERRFRRVQISIRFQDETKRSTHDPEVEIISTSVPSEFASIEGGGAAWVRERCNANQTKDRTYLVGAKRIEGRNYGKKNAIRVNLFENSIRKSGVVTELQTAILLNRRNDDRFLAHVVVDATADFTCAAKRAMGRMLRTSPFNDPIVFDPELSRSKSPKAIITNIDPDDLTTALADLGRGVLPKMVLLTTGLATPTEATGDYTKQGTEHAAPSLHSAGSSSSLP